MELPDALYEEITDLCEEGDEQADNEDFPAAIKKYEEAWSLLPEPKTEWEASTWVLSAIGDAQFSMSNYSVAAQTFQKALQCPEAVGNSFLHLRLGQCYFELDDKGNAAQELTRAYMGAGPELFDEEDPKYFSLLEQVLEPPAGQNKL